MRRTQGQLYPRGANYQHPSHEEVWQRVHDFATQRADKRLPVFTLQRKVRNFIADVRPYSIGRRSDEGRTNSSRVERSAVKKVWEELVKKGVTNAPVGVLYFVPALMLAAMPDVIEYVGNGEIALRNNPKIAERDRRRVERVRQGEDGRAGGESEMHRAIKDFIFQEPDIALRRLGPGPYTRVRQEYTFPTGDRVDVVLLDRNGNVLLIEVKPVVSSDDVSPWAQAKKYRALWSVFEERVEDEIRCVVAAPRLPQKLVRRMFRNHRTESVAVRPPMRRNKARGA